MLNDSSPHNKQETAQVFAPIDAKRIGSAACDDKILQSFFRPLRANKEPKINISLEIKFLLDFRSQFYCFHGLLIMPACVAKAYLYLHACFSSLILKCMSAIRVVCKKTQLSKFSADEKQSNSLHCIRKLKNGAHLLEVEKNEIPTFLRSRFLAFSIT